MCRWLVYQGEPVFMEEIALLPCNSLITQSRRACKSKTEVNGDGLGVGWYSDKKEPGLYREVMPAWSDENLKHLCQQIKSRLFFAHVRASTGSASLRSNCHPFSYKQWMFMHNGQIGDFQLVRREVEAMIPDSVYACCRHGTTDSEAIFLALLGEGLEQDPIKATMSVLNRIHKIMIAKGITQALRFTAALSDGNKVYAFRMASDHLAPSLFYIKTSEGIILASEPLDAQGAKWNAIEANSAVILENSEISHCDFTLETSAECAA